MNTTCRGVLATFNSHLEAETAIKDLQRAQGDMRSLSIVGRDFHTEEHVVGYYNTGERMEYWGKLGAFWGGIWGLLFGSAVFLIPGFGPLIVGGPIVAWILGGLEGAVVAGGISAIGAGLFSVGMPKDAILRYEAALTTGKYLLVVHGTPEEVARAREVLKATAAEAVDEHDLETPAVQTTLAAS
jgi:hypothetical protein